MTATGVDIPTAYCCSCELALKIQLSAFFCIAGTHYHLVEMYLVFAPSPLHLYKKRKFVKGYGNVTFNNISVILFVEKTIFLQRVTDKLYKVESSTSISIS